MSGGQFSESELSALVRLKDFLSNRQWNLLMSVNHGWYERWDAIELKQALAMALDQCSLHPVASSPVEKLDIEVATINFGSSNTRIQNILKDQRVRYVGDLVQCNDAMLLGRKNFGRKSLCQVKEWMNENGFGNAMGHVLKNDWVRPHLRRKVI